MQSKSKYFFFVFIILLGCTQEQENQIGFAEVALPEPGIEEYNGNTGNQKLEIRSNSNSRDTKIIQNGTLILEVKNAAEFMHYLDSSILDLKARIVQSSQEKQYNRNLYHYTLKVPHTQFMALIAFLEQKSNSIESKTIGSTDVTEEYIDVMARLKVFKNTENQYLTILEKAKTIKDILAVEKELTRIRAEIETFEGRIRYLNSKTKEATLEVQFYEFHSDIQSSPNPSFWSQFKNAGKAGWVGIKMVFLFLVRLWPLALAVPVFVWFRRKKSVKRKV